MKPLELSEKFRAQIRAYPKAPRLQIGQALQRLESDFGDPHRHQGLGIRKLRGNLFEIRAGLDVRLIFKNNPDALLFLRAGGHNEVQRFLRRH